MTRGGRRPGRSRPGDLPSARGCASDVVAGLVLSTLLVPQGMAYAELAGLPAITGLYTIDPVPARLRGVRAVADPRARPGLVAGADDRGDDPADRRRERRPGARGRAGVDARADGRRDHDRRRGRAARLRRRPALEADADRLHERPRADDPRRPAAEAVRVLGRRRRADRRGARRSSTASRRATRSAPPSRSACVSLARDPRPRARGCRRSPACSSRSSSRSRRRPLLDLGDHGVSLVGTLPAGLPAAHAARAPVSDLAAAASPARSASRSSRSPTRSRRRRRSPRARGQEVDGNGEMIGIGAANVAAGLFQGFPVSTSGSRTAVAEQAGAKTQLTGVVGAAAIVLMLVLVPGLLRNLPQPTLAAVVIAASLSLADIPGTRAALAPAPRRVPALDRRASSASRCSASCRASRSPSRCRSSTSSGAPGGRTRRRSAASRACPATTTATLHPDGEELPGLVIFRFDAPLFFANARTFRDADPPARGGRPAPALDRHRRRADHRRRHDRRRHARRPRRGAQRRRARRSCSPSSRTRSARSSSATS